MPSKSKKKAAARESKAAMRSALEKLLIALPDVDESDPDMFDDPPPREDCPICMLTLPFQYNRSSYYRCCGKVVCSACEMENCRVLEEKRQKKEKLPGAPSTLLCPFCREPALSDKEEKVLQLNRRVELNDPEAMLHLGREYSMGGLVPKDEYKALELVCRSAEVGSTQAYLLLASWYSEGRCVKADKTKYRRLLLLAAKGGDMGARCKLAALAFKKDNFELAVNHLRVSAAAGDQAALDGMKVAYKDGHVSKNLLEKTLRAYQASQEDMKSEERDRYAAAITGGTKG